MHPFRSVWLHPKQTARFFIDQKSVLYAMVIVVLGFMASGLLGFQNTGMYPDIPYAWIVISVLIFAPILGVITYGISVGISFFIGKLLGGTGTFSDVGKGLSAGYIPFVVAGPIYLLWLVISPESFFVQEVTDVMAILGAIVSIVTSIWAVVITIGALAEAHRYSTERAFLTVIIPTILLFAALIAIIFFIIAVFTAANL
ncbi:MAG: YIP1 family protein [Solibacillus sp.]